ncbi:MAG: hypothetical protein ACFFCZ_20200 [Promethearchaeota archaeon]
MFNVSLLSMIGGWIWSKIAMILVGALIVSLLYNGYQVKTIRSQAIKIEELGGKYMKCQEIFKNSINISNNLFDSYKYDEEQLIEREKKCRELLEKSDKPLTEEEVRRLFQ